MTSQELQDLLKKFGAATAEEQSVLLIQSFPMLIAHMQEQDREDEKNHQTVMAANTLALKVLEIQGRLLGLSDEMLKAFDEFKKSQVAL